MPGRPPSAHLLAAIALVGGVLQILATVLLGLAPVEALEAIATEGATDYLFGTLAVIAGLLVVWWLRRRPLLAVAVFIGWQAAVFWPMRRRTTLLGWAYYEEFILHHFLALLCAFTSLLLLSRWARTATAPRPVRWLPLILAAPGIAGLLLAHVAAITELAPQLARIADGVGTALLLASWITGLGLLWHPRMATRINVVATVLVIPAVLRVALAGTGGFRGEPVADDGQSMVMGSVIVAATITFVLFRPRLERWLQGVVILVSATATAIFYVLYSKGFGELEDSLGGLTQSLFGFPLPYPSYVATWKIILVMLAVFFILVTVYGGLVSTRDRSYGIALGLMAVSGIGFTTPQLVLMASTGFLLLVDGARQGLVDDARLLATAPPHPIDEVLAKVASALGLPEPIGLEEGRDRLLRVRGELDDVNCEMRSRTKAKGHPAVMVRAGVSGRARPDLELIPAAEGSGRRPHHAIGRTHKVRGSFRILEDMDDDLLDSLTAFPDAHIKFWAAGAQVELGRDLSQLESPTLRRLVEALCRTLR